MVRQKKKGKGLRKVFSTILIIAGIAILGSYVGRDIYYAVIHSEEGQKIETAVSSLDRTDYSEYEKQAAQYNDSLSFGSTQEGTWPYKQQLAVLGEDQPFAELLVPSIALEMPIYHGTDEESLMNGVGHLEGSSLPVGGKTTRSVLTAHSGMSGMRAFDDIRQLEKGDIFLIKVLGKTLAYRVYKTEVVWPQDVEALIGIESGRDLCTLITCTPYGVNDHRLLVHGERTEYEEEMAEPVYSVRKVVKSRRYGPFIFSVAAVIAAAVLGFIRRHKDKKKNEDQT